MTIYADTSFFVSLYLPDQHSTKAEGWLLSEPGIWLTPLHVAEWTHAVEQHVFREEISIREALVLHDRFWRDLKNGVWTEISLPESAYARCIELGRKYAAKFGLRTLDTLHVASALELNSRNFWTFDERQQKLARAAGLKPG